MSDDLPYDEWLDLIGDLSNPLPYGDGTIRIFIDAVAYVLGGFDLLPSERRTAGDFFHALQIVVASRVRQAAGVPRIEEVQDLMTTVARLSTVYQHTKMAETGRGLPACTLEPPCPHHL